MERLTDRWLTPENVGRAGLLDRERVLGVAARAEGDALKARRNDILLNHLVQLHILHEQLGAGAVAA